MISAPFANAAATSANLNDVTTAGINTTGASLIVLAAVADSLPSAVPTDTFNNSWLSLGISIVVGSIPGTQLWYAKSPLVGPAHTFTYTATAKSPALAVMAFGGDVATPTANNFVHSPLEAGAVSVPSVTSLTLAQSYVPESPFQLLLTAVGHLATVSAVAVDSGFTITNTVAATANGYGISFAYRLSAQGSGVNPKWTWTTVSSASMRVAAFDASKGWLGERL